MSGVVVAALFISAPCRYCSRMPTSQQLCGILRTRPLNRLGESIAFGVAMVEQCGRGVAGDARLARSGREVDNAPWFVLVALYLFTAYLWACHILRLDNFPLP